MAGPTRNAVKEEAGQLNTTRYLSYREYLKALYLRVKKKLDRYSYLKFANDLGFSETNVIRLVITGQRPLTSKAAERIAKALELHGPERRVLDNPCKIQQCAIAG